MPDRFRSAFERPLFRCAMTIVAIAVSFWLRYELVDVLGLALPPFLIFFPAILLVAVLAGFWSGLVATALFVLGTDYLILPPTGSLAIARLSEVFLPACWPSITGAASGSLRTTKRSRNSKIAKCSITTSSIPWRRGSASSRCSSIRWASLSITNTSR